MNQSTAPPLLVFGFDAGDPELMLEWAHDGTLPALGSILRRGCWARTAGPEMISEHGMWVSLTSGVSRAEHGYYYHRQLVPGTYDLRPARGRDCGVAPFWVGCPHRRVAIVDVPDIAAPSPQEGIQVSEWATHYPYFPPSTLPSDALARIGREYGPQMVIHEEPDSTYAADRGIFDRLMDRAARKARLCLDLIESDRFDLVFMVFAECHTGAHQFWKYRNMASSSADGGDLSGAVRDTYRAIDAALGAVVARLPPESAVFVVSSVGIKDQWPAAGLNEVFCRGLGYQASPASSASFQPMNLIRRVLPQGARDRLSRILSRTAQDALISDKFRSSTDWTRTTAFSIPAYYTGQFRVNLRGREPQGIVAPGAEYEQLLDLMESDLRALIDPVTQQPAIKAVRRTSTLYGGGIPDTLPDLFAEWADTTHFVTRVVHPRTELQQVPCEFHRGTDHSQFGFVAAAGSMVSGRGDLGCISPLDLVPTLLTHLRCPSSTQLAGKVIQHMSSSADRSHD